MSEELLDVEKEQQELLLKQQEVFRNDTALLGRCTADYVSNFFPAYSIIPRESRELKKEDSLELLNKFTFYKLSECTIDNVDDMFLYFATKMQKLFTTAYSIKQNVCYGIVSNAGTTSLVIGIAPDSNNNMVRKILEGLLPGMKVEEYTDKFINSTKMVDGCEYDNDRYVGCISGIPALKVDGEFLSKDLSSLMRSLNGENYTIMVMCKPIDEFEIQEKINAAIKIKDECFGISKRTVSMQRGSGNSTTHSEMHNESDGTQINTTNGMSMSGAGSGAAMGAAMGAGIGALIGESVGAIGGVIEFGEIGASIGATGGGIGGAIGGGIGGGIIGLIVGKQFNFNQSESKGKSHTVTDGYSDAVTDSVNKSATISGEVQNGYAMELMQMAETMTDRLKVGRSIGMWEAVISYSSDNEMASKIIQGSLYSEVASGIPDVLPPVTFAYKDSCFDEENHNISIHTQQVLIPEGFFAGKGGSPLSSLVTSEELCGVCTIPTDNTVGFEIKKSKGYAINNQCSSNDIELGKICEYERPLSNMFFGLSEDDLNKHTFVSGITGSGKTNTVKHILESVDKPFLVIEPAKKEYRNLIKKVQVYTLGRPEINCIKLNPFYIMPGISPQQHIDLLKDLFCASFALYGPMPYIVEKCLYNTYTKKGWNLTLGFHPCLAGGNNATSFYDKSAIEKKYSLKAHRFFFPTMQDLKDEVDYYIENEMTYDGEVKGNIRSAIKARIDSLCVGAKGYMYNTYDVTNFDELFNTNTVLELEGLADDADKAFSLGLLIILVNEYRQVKKETTEVNGLEHLLVIEEAHRLLKNVSSENNEELGNPKGKAVEHFTNMLAEMRSYGQGVIVAEQIPSKLAPDVIKNSSNKIIHRLVALDDQEAVANTIGVSVDDAIYLGNQKPGYALCHKEGMAQPVTVKIDEIVKNNVLDTKLYEQDIESKMFSINKSIITTQLSEIIDTWAVKILVSIMNGIKAESLFAGVEKADDAIDHLIALNSIALIPGVDKKACIVSGLSEAITSLLISGVFSNHQMPSDELIESIVSTVEIPKEDKISKLRSLLEKFYKKKPETRAVEIVAALVSDEYASGIDITALANDFLLYDDVHFVSLVKVQLR